MNYITKIYRYFKVLMLQKNHNKTPELDMNVDESYSEFAQQQTLEKRNEIPETTSSSYLISYKPAGAEFSNVA